MKPNNIDTSKQILLKPLLIHRKYYYISTRYLQRKHSEKA